MKINFPTCRQKLIENSDFLNFRRRCDGTQKGDVYNRGGWGEVHRNRVRREVRTVYWLVQGRAQVKSFLYRCYLCKKYGARLLQKPPAAPLPDVRAQYADPFAVSGSTTSDLCMLIQHRRGRTRRSRKFTSCCLRVRSRERYISTWCRTCPLLHL